MVALGLVVGLATGGIPAYASTISLIALVSAMTFSLAEIQFRGLRLRPEVRSVAVAFLLNYGLLTAYLLAVASLFADSSLRDGWVVQAAVPSAIAVVPYTSAVRGNVRSVLVATAALYVAALALVPGITLAFASASVSPWAVAEQTFLQLLLPIALSRAVTRMPWIQGPRPAIVNLSLATLVVMVTGANRAVFFGSFDVLAAVSLAAIGRTFLLGGVVLIVLRILQRPRDEVIASTGFASFKNLGLTALLALSLFGPPAAIPAVVTLFFEILWLAVLARVLRDRVPGQGSAT